MESYSRDGGSNMNGDIPSVPVTTLSGLATLTQLLPELPLPGPIPGPTSAPASTLLFHHRVEEEAALLLRGSDPHLAQALAQALQSTPEQYLDLVDTSGSTLTNTLSLPLAQQVLHHNPAAFGQSTNHQAAWSHGVQGGQGHGQGYEEGYGGGGGWDSHSNHSRVQNSHQALNGSSEHSVAAAFPDKQNFNQNINQNYKIPKQKDESNSNSNRAVGVSKNFKVEVNNKLSKEDQNLMQKRLNELKFGENPSYNNFSPRARKKDPTYKDRSDSESSEDEEGNPKTKSKFFKHTERERNEEKQKRKEERRKRKDEGEDYEPDEEGRGKKRRHGEGDDSDSSPEDDSWLKRRRFNDPEDSPVPAQEDFVPKKVTRKVEKKYLAQTSKMDADEIMESSNFLKFNKTMELIFETAEEVNMVELNEDEEGKEIPTELLVPKYQAADLAGESAKLKSMSAMQQIPTDRLVKLLSILSWNIKDGSSVVPIAMGDDDDEEDDDKLFLELASERVMRAAECAICAMNIMTSSNMSKRVYLDDIIDRIAVFVRFQLQKTIYPSFDPVYKEISKNKDAYIGSMKKKRNYAPTVRDRKILNLYNRCNEIVTLLGDLIHVQRLTDTTVLHLSSLGVAPFFVENIPEIQLSALKLTTGVFSQYDKHRKLVLDDILASIARLPQTKRSLRTFRLNREENIQMLTALVMQLIQCVVNMPDNIGKKKDDKKKKPRDENEEAINGEDEPILDRDVHVNNLYESAMATAVQFLTVFLKKCGSKQEEIDYRPLFENFLQDLLTTVNTPEWPAAELLLSLLGKMLVGKFANKQTEVTLRVSSLEYLGTVASRLRKDAVQSKLKVDMIDQIIQTVKDAEEESGEFEDEEFEKLDPEEQRTRFLQRVLLDYLTVNGGEEDASTLSARHFYIAQWYRDANAEIQKQNTGQEKPKKKDKHDKKRSRRRVDSESESDSSSSSEDERSDRSSSDPRLAEVFRLTEARKDYLVTKVSPFGEDGQARAGSVVSHLDSTSAALIVKYLSSKRPFFNSFDLYLKQILSVLTEQSVQVRSKALKCMALVVQEDPSVLSRDDMQRGVNFSFLDSATMVREAAVDLIGKFVMHRKELIDKYYQMLLNRILDTGVSVRKRVIKILKDICLEFPDYPKIPEICVKMIRRINDEEGIRKLVMEVFQNMWFMPLEKNSRHRTDREQELLVIKAQNITDVVVACKDVGLEWFEQLLQFLLKPKEDKDDATKVNKEPPKQLVLACQQIVDCLIEQVLKTEEKDWDSRAGIGQSHRIVACLTTAFLFAKTRAQLLVNHVQTLQPYLNVKCQTQGDYQIISNVARTLELVVPLIEHPSEIFLSQLEEASIKLIILHDKTVVAACLSCLGSVVNNVTKNFTLIRDTFKKYFGHLIQFKKAHEKDPSDPRLPANSPMFRRSLFTVGLLLRHFDFTLEELYAGLEWGSETKMTVFENIYYFLDHESYDIQNATLQALGFMCIRHYDLMMDERLKQRYISILTSRYHSTQYATQQKITVLQNIETYLVEEEIRMIAQDKKWKEYQVKENLKEMGDVSSGMASTVIQIYLSSVLDSFIHPSVQVRHAALKVIQLILAQGLVHPVQIVPYLICMSTDAEQRVSHTADKELQDIEKKYPGFIHMKLMEGIRLSYQLQHVLPRRGGEGPVRGFRTKEGELPSALNGFLYSCLRANKSQRRAILMMLLKQFDETSHNDLSTMLYLADNLAYIPYTVVDEPLFLIHHIDIMVSVIGAGILQAIKEMLHLPPEYEVKMNPETLREEYHYDEDLDDDPVSVLTRLPYDKRGFVDNINTAQGCILLLVLREHLKDFYGLNEVKIEAYSPSESQKIYEKPVHRKGNAKFNPKATVEILKLGDIDPSHMDEDAQKDLIKKYLTFKELMNKIEKDDEEYDEDGNVIAQGPKFNAKEVQNFGMPTMRHNGHQAGYQAGHQAIQQAGQQPPLGMKNLAVRIQNVPLSSLPNHFLPDDIASVKSNATTSKTVDQISEAETGMWIVDSKKPSRSNSPSPEKKTYSQESQKVPKLTINLGPKRPMEHAFFADLDKSAKERDQRRNKHKEKHKKKKKKKKHYRSESEESDSESDIEYLD